MRVMLLPSIALALYCGSSRAEAAPAAPTAGPDQRRITVDLQRVPLRDALRFLFHGHADAYQVVAGVSDVPITLHARDAQLSRVVEGVAQAAALEDPGIVLSREGERFQVRMDRHKADLEDEKGRVRIGGEVPAPHGWGAVERSGAGEGAQVSMDVRELPFRQAVWLLMRGSGLQFTLAPQTADPLVTVKVEHTPISAALKSLVDAAAGSTPGLTLTRAGDIYEIKTPPAAEPVRRVTLNLQEISLRGAVSKLVQGSGLQYDIAPNVPDVRITQYLRDLPVPAALEKVVARAAEQIPGLSLALEDGLYRLYIRQGTAAPGPDEDAPRLITLDLKDVPLREALDLLFKNSGQQYTVDPNVPDVPITLHVRDIRLPAALRLIIRQAAVQVPGLTYAKEGDVYMTRMRSM